MTEKTPKIPAVDEQVILDCYDETPPQIPIPIGEFIPSEDIVKPPESKRTRCEIYSRVVGYLRPVNQWNDGKKEEFSMRTRYPIPQGENGEHKS